MKTQAHLSLSAILVFPLFIYTLSFEILLFCAFAIGTTQLINLDAIMPFCRHRRTFHNIPGIVFWAIIVAVITYLTAVALTAPIQSTTEIDIGLINVWTVTFIAFIATLLGNTSHLIGDLITQPLDKRPLTPLNPLRNTVYTPYLFDRSSISPDDSLPFAAWFIWICGTLARYAVYPLWIA